MIMTMSLVIMGAVMEAMGSLDMTVALASPTTLSSMTVILMIQVMRLMTMTMSLVMETMEVMTGVVIEAMRVVVFGLLSLCL
jgi:hypothetical protein